MRCNGTGRWLEPCGITMRCNRFMFPCSACGWKGLSEKDLEEMDKALRDKSDTSVHVGTEHPSVGE
jgi:hypothetical protein